MQDEYAIQQLLNTYSQYGSLGDWDEVVPLYLPGGIWEIPHLGMTFEGHEAIRGALTAFFATMDYVLQLNSPALIEVTGDRATVRSGIRESGKLAGREEGFEFFGLYVDDLVRTAEGWKFARRVFQGLGTHYVPLVKGPG